jgi:hypothetical protein
MEQATGVGVQMVEAVVWGWKARMQSGAVISDGSVGAGLASRLYQVMCSLRFENHRATLGNSHPVDVYVGARTRERRLLLTLRKIQKYERCFNRIGSSQLVEFAKVLDLPCRTSSMRCRPMRFRAGRCLAVAARASASPAPPQSHPYAAKGPFLRDLQPPRSLHLT